MKKDYEDDPVDIMESSFEKNPRLRHLVNKIWSMTQNANHFFIPYERVPSSSAVAHSVTRSP